MRTTMSVAIEVSEVSSASQSAPKATKDLPHPLSHHKIETC